MLVPKLSTNIACTSLAEVTQVHPIQRSVPEILHPTSTKIWRLNVKWQQPRRGAGVHASGSSCKGIVETVCCQVELVPRVCASIIAQWRGVEVVEARGSVLVAAVV